MKRLALVAILSLTPVSPALAQQAVVEGSVRIGLPDADWELDVQREGYLLVEDRLATAGDGRRLTYATSDGQTDLVVTLAPVAEGQGPVQTREARWEELAPGLGSAPQVKFWNEGHVAMMEYLVSSGGNVDRHVHAFIHRGDTSIEVHAYGGLDAGASEIDPIFRSLRIRPR